MLNDFKIMTNYLWMHWFWITFINLIALSHTKHSNIPENQLINSSIPSDNNNNNNSIIKRNITHYERNNNITNNNNFNNITTTTTTKLDDVLPLNESEIEWINKNSNNYNNNNNITSNNNNSTVINYTTTELSNFTELISNRNQLLNNFTENSTIYFGNELTYNHSFIQSERIGIVEGDLNNILDDVDDNNISLGNLSAAGITGITLGCIILVGIICGVSFFIYHNRGFNRPQVLNDRCSIPDSSGYIDDASIRDNSEEMYSLDNDSFLNSLEAMTIQNYWTDTVKHTKL